MTSVQTIDMEIIRGGLPIEVTVEGSVGYYEESDYGADADGGRGVKRLVITEVRNVQAFLDTFANVKLTDAEVEQASELLTSKFLGE